MCTQITKVLNLYKFGLKFSNPAAINFNHAPVATINTQRRRFYYKKTRRPSFKGLLISEEETAKNKKDNTLKLTSTVVERILAAPSSYTEEEDDDEKDDLYEKEEIAVASPIEVRNLVTVEELASLLKLEPQQIEEHLIKFPRLVDRTFKGAEFALSKWRSVGLTETDLQNYPWLILRSPDLAKLRRSQLREFQKGPDAIEILELETWSRVALLAVLPWKRSLYYFKLHREGSSPGWQDMFKEFEERVDYFVKELEIEHFAVIRLGSRFPFLFTRDLEILKKKMHFFKHDAKLDLEEMKADLWCLKSSLETANFRLPVLQKCGIPLRPWMFRIQGSILSKAIRDFEEHTAIFGDGDIAAYLMSRLKIGLKEVAKMNQSNWHLHKIRSSKLDEMLEILLANGIKEEQIVKQPRILSKSIDTVVDRIHQFKRFNYKFSAIDLNVSHQNFRKQITYLKQAKDRTSN